MNFIENGKILDEYLPWSEKVQQECRQKSQIQKKRGYVMSQPNINFMMNMTNEYLSGEIDVIDYSLDFPYELEKRYKKMHREDDDYCELIYECLYEEGLALFNELSESELRN